MNYIRFEEIYARAAELLGYTEKELKEVIGEPDREFSSDDEKQKYFVYSQLEFGLALDLNTGIIVGMVCPYQPDDEKIQQGYYDVLGLKIGDDVDRIYQMWGPPSEKRGDIFVYNTKLGTTTRGVNYQVELAIENGRLREFNCMLVSSEKPKPKSGCFIATACYGDYDAAEVLILRRYRDNVLLKSKLGKIVVSIYYLVSPPLAKMIAKNNSVKNFIRKYLLSPIISKITTNHNY